MFAFQPPYAPPPPPGFPFQFPLPNLVSPVSPLGGNSVYQEQQCDPWFLDQGNLYLLQKKYITEDFDEIMAFLHPPIDPPAESLLDYGGFVAFLISGMGTGKSEFVSRLLTNLPRDTRVRILSPRRSLTDALAQRFKDQNVKSYLSLGPHKNFYSELRLIISPESNHKDKDQNSDIHIPDYFIVDEIDTFLLHTGSSKTMKERLVEFLTVFNQYLAHPNTKVVLLDACVSPLTARVIQEILKNQKAGHKRLAYVINSYRSNICSDMKLVASLGDWQRKLRECISKCNRKWRQRLTYGEHEDRIPVTHQIIICFGSKKELFQTKQDILQNELFNETISADDFLILTSETDENVRAEHSSDPSKWNTYPFVFYTCTILCGLDYKPADNTKVYVFGLPCKWTPPLVMFQMCGRARKAEQWIWFCPFARDHEIEQLPVEWEDIVDQWTDTSHGVWQKLISEFNYVARYRVDDQEVCKIGFNPNTSGAVLAVYGQTLANRAQTNFLWETMNIWRRFNSDWEVRCQNGFYDRYRQMIQQNLEKIQTDNIALSSVAYRSAAEDELEKDKRELEELFGDHSNEAIEEVAKNYRNTLFDKRTQKEKHRDMLVTLMRQYGVDYLPPRDSPIFEPVRLQCRALLERLGRTTVVQIRFAQLCEGVDVCLIDEFRRLRAEKRDWVHLKDAMRTYLTLRLAQILELKQVKNTDRPTIEVSHMGETAQAPRQVVTTPNPQYRQSKIYWDNHGFEDHLWAGTFKGLMLTRETLYEKCDELFGLVEQHKAAFDFCWNEDNSATRFLIPPSLWPIRIRKHYPAGSPTPCFSITNKEKQTLGKYIRKLLTFSGLEFESKARIVRHDAYLVGVDGDPVIMNNGRRKRRTVKNWYYAIHEKIRTRSILYSLPQLKTNPLLLHTVRTWEFYELFFSQRPPTAEMPLLEPPAEEEIQELVIEEDELPRGCHWADNPPSPPPTRRGRASSMGASASSSSVNSSSSRYLRFLDAEAGLDGSASEDEEEEYISESEFVGWLAEEDEDPELSD